MPRPLAPTLARLSLASALISTLALAGAAQAADLHVSFNGIKTESGAVLVAVYESEDAYNAGKAVASGMVAVKGTTAEATIKGLKPGRYAFKAFHDLDGDFKMASNPFGMPTEPYAFSNDAKPEGAPPTWNRAAFDIAEPGAAQSVHID